MYGTEEAINLYGDPKSGVPDTARVERAFRHAYTPNLAGLQAAIQDWGSFNVSMGDVMRALYSRGYQSIGQVRKPDFAPIMRELGATVYEW